MKSAENAFLTCAEAAAYLGFRTSAGIRTLVYRGELEPDGIGARNGLLFKSASLDDLAQRRLDRKRRLAARKSRGASNG